MNIEQMTQKTREALQAAQRIAVEYSNNAVEQEHLLAALAQQQDHSAGGGTGIQHKDLFFRVLRQNQISRGHGGVIGAGKLRGDGHADGFLALLEGLGIGGGIIHRQAFDQMGKSMLEEQML